MAALGDTTCPGCVSNSQLMCWVVGHNTLLVLAHLFIFFLSHLFTLPLAPSQTSLAITSQISLFFHFLFCHHQVLYCCSLLVVPALFCRWATAVLAAWLQNRCGSILIWGLCSLLCLKLYFCCKLLSSFNTRFRSWCFDCGLKS